MTGKVIDFPWLSDVDLSPIRVLSQAGEADLKEVIVIGVDANDDAYFNSNMADAFRTVYQLERAKHKLMVIIDQAGE
jgi:hypothetical protein